MRAATSGETIACVSDLQRFLEAQAQPHAGFATALAELRAGQKRGHWIWYSFPQLAGLGQSAMSIAYALRDLAEAKEYLTHPTLRSRLLQLSEAVATSLRAGARVDTLMGSSIDATKLVSSLTLFRHAASELNTAAAEPEFQRLSELASEILSLAERQGYPACRFTLAAVGAPSRGGAR